MNEQKAIESALKKVEAQQENFGFMKLFDVDEHWAVKEALKKQIPKKVNNLAGKMLQLLLRFHSLRTQ